MQKPVGASSVKVFLRFVVITAVLGLVTVFCFKVAKFNATTTGFIYLLAVLFTASVWGLVESTFASVISVLAFNFFFLPPVGTLTIADPQNWAALLAFLATSVTASQLSATIRRQAAQATLRQREMEQLYSLSRAILLLDPNTSVTQQMAAHIARVFDSPAVVIFEKEENRFQRAGPQDIQGIEELLREAAMRGIQTQDTSRRAVITAIRLGADPIGSLALLGGELSDTALQGLANLAAIGIERAHAREQANKAEAARQSDELKSTLLDAIAHEFKTPLTSIKAASTTLLSDFSLPVEQRQDLISVVDEEADRLSILVTEAIQMARLDSGKIRLNRISCDPGELVAGAAEPLQRVLEGRPLQVELARDLPLLNVDAELLQLALRQLIDNAVKYSPPGASIKLSVCNEESQIIFTVQDQGPGIPDSERGRIFDRFYRSPANRNSVSGAGLGLSIAKDIVRAHGGSIWVDGGAAEGAAFRISLPVHAESSS